MKLELDCSHSLGELSLAVNTTIVLDHITGLFGPSGAGKTTLLRIIAGLERQARGVIRLDEQLWQANTGEFVLPHLRRIGYVFQEGRLFSHLDVNGNLGYGLKRRDGKINQEAVVAALDLAPLLARRIGTLSGGEQQRVAIGRALLSQPRLLLMDEPVSALDMPRRREVLGYLQKLPEIFHIPIIYVSHAIEEIASLATNVLILSQGRLLRNGTVTEVFGDTGTSGLTDQPGSVLKATVIGHDHRFQHSVLDVAGQQMLVPGTGHATGSKLRLHIHARDVSIALKQPEQISIRNIITATVSGIVDTPDSSWVEVQLDVNGSVLRSRITRLAAADLGLRNGQKVYALIKGVSLDWQFHDRTQRPSSGVC